MYYMKNLKSNVFAKLFKKSTSAVGLFKMLAFYTFFIVFFSTQSFAQIYSCTGTFYDDGGEFGHYSNGSQVLETYCSDSGSQIKLNFETFDVEANFDFLFIYDGIDVHSPLIGVYTNGNSPKAIVSSTGCLTILFESDATTNGAGYAFDIFCVDTCNIEIAGVQNSGASCGNDDGIITVSASGAEGELIYSIDGGETFQEDSIFSMLSGGRYDVVVSYADGSCTLFVNQYLITTGCQEICNNGIDDDGDQLIDEDDSDCDNTIFVCTGDFYDLGGSSVTYPADTTYVTTLCSDNGGQIQVTFTEFELNLQSPADTLIVYDGPNTDSLEVGRYFGQSFLMNQEFRAKSFFLSTDGCLTFKFISGLFGVSTGWEAKIDCTDSPSYGVEICGNGLDDDFDGMIDSQDPDCSESLGHSECKLGFTYYIPPVWKMSGEAQSYSSPAVLSISTVFPKANVNIRTADNSWNQTLSLTSEASTTIAYDDLTKVLRSDVFNSPENDKGLIISSDFPIKVLYLLDGGMNKNLISVKGAESLGKSFRVGSQTNTLTQTVLGITRDEHHFISVMATEDNTTVNFDFQRPFQGLVSPHIINLDAGETYMVINEDTNVSVTGALVTSDKDIVVLSGSQHTSASGVKQNDGGVDMLVPAEVVGNQYVLVRGEVSEAQDYGIVAALENNTKVFVDQVEVANLDAGDFIEVDVTGPVGRGTYIETTKNAYVYQVSGLGSGEVGMAIVAPLGGCRGDDFASFSKLSSTSQYALNIVIEDSGLPTLTLNGIDVSTLSSTMIIAVDALPGYSTVTIRDADIATDNVIESSKIFHASLLVGDLINSSSLTFITSFDETLKVLDPNIGEAVGYYVVDTICRNESVLHTLNTASCGTHEKIRKIEQGTLGTAVLVGDKTFVYTNNGQTGTDVLSLSLINDLGVESSVCIGVEIDSVFVSFIEIDTTICAGDMATLELDSIGGTGPYNFLWSTGEITQTIDVTPSASSAYQVTVTDAIGCKGEDAFDVSISPIVIADAGPEIVVCTGEVANLSAVQPQGTTGQWSGGTGSFMNPNSPTTQYIAGPNETDGLVELFWTLEGSSGMQCFSGMDSTYIQITPLLTVYAGDDTFVCSDTQFSLSTLNASINSADVTTGTWTTSGDGVFIPGATATGVFPSSSIYVPGISDQANGKFELILDATDPNSTSGCGTGTDSALITIQDSPVLVCNDNINISVNKSCLVELTVDMFIENPTDPVEYYTINLVDEFGNDIDGTTLNSSFVNRTIEYNITYSCGGNSCWGNLTIEDKQIPDLIPDSYFVDCRDAVSPSELGGFPVPPSATVFLNNGQYFAGGFDGCGNVLLEFEDEIIDNGCSAEYETVIYRNWTATDESGNISMAQDTISIARIELEDIALPPSYDDLDEPSLSCSDVFEVTDEGVPTPEETGSPDAGTCENFQSSYTDLIFPTSAGTVKIIREWLIFDWCSSTSLKHFQTIKILDKEGPMISCPQNVTLNTDDFSCNSGLILLTLPNAVDLCSEVTIAAEAIGPNGESIDVFNNNGNLVVADLPLGSTIIKYIATDGSELSSSCSYTISIIDNVPPTPICEGFTKVSVNNIGSARLFATSLDDGSHDNCEIATIRIAKMTDACGIEANVFGEYIDFCCEEIGGKIMVALEVTDIYGNSNVCTAEVELEDKLAPIITAPSDLTISCSTGFDEEDLSSFGKIAFSVFDQKDIMIFDEENNGIVGQDGLALDNCNLTISETIEIDIECGVGEITRTFIATDDYNQQSSSMQVITVVNSTPFTLEDIEFPTSITVDGCMTIDSEPETTGFPIYSNEDCSSILHSYEDQVFTIADSACLLILREWKVIDLCQYNPSTGNGIWSQFQSIKLNNQVKPAFLTSCEDTTICTYGECEGSVFLEVLAEDDCTATELLVYSWSIDSGDDGSIEWTGEGRIIDRNLMNGIYRVRWLVEDLCGNIESCSYLVTVEDCKEPTPYCIGGISTALMNNVGMVEIAALSFDLGSYDNCTDEQNLQFSFSQDTNDTTRIFTCEDLENGVAGTIELLLWVTDEAGNQDYCTVDISVQDNFDVCPNIGTATISGIIENLETEKMSNVDIVLSSDLGGGNSTSFSDEEGVFAFPDLAPGLKYNVSAKKNNDVLNGVSTLDIVIIQKHILGLQLFDTPQKYIAADVNHSESVSGADIIQIRKAILGYYNEFPNNDSWRFIDKSHVFNDFDYYDFKEYISYDPLSGDENNSDFIGIKIGDINGSASVNGAISEADLRTDGRYSFIIRTTANGDAIEFVADETIHVEGLQMEISWLGGQFAGVTPGVLNIEDQHHLAVANQHVKFAFNASTTTKIEAGEVAFSIHLNEMDADVVLSTITTLGNSIEAQLYDSQLNTWGIEFRTEHDDQKLGLELHQNTPNPFNGMTTISFVMPELEEVELWIMDASGKLVMKRQIPAQKGYNQINISGSELHNKGIYYYQLNTSFGSDTRKMILMN